MNKNQNKYKKKTVAFGLALGAIVVCLKCSIDWQI
jgi:hypothetical protein